MKRINPAIAAFSVGLVIALYHAAWVALVATGLAKPLLDYVLRLHSIELSYTMAPFNVDTAVMLIVITYAVGALFGLVFALIWNGFIASFAKSEQGRVRQRGESLDGKLAS